MSTWTINSTLAVMATENGDTDWAFAPLSNTLKGGTRSIRVVFGNEPYQRTNPLFTTVEAAYTALRDAYRALRRDKRVAVFVKLLALRFRLYYAAE